VRTATQPLYRAWRALVDGLASTRLLRDKAGQNSAWWHYEHHRAAWQRSQDFHARQRERAQRRPGHERKAG
jgi:hypothetical protein